MIEYFLFLIIITGLISLFISWKKIISFFNTKYSKSFFKKYKAVIILFTFLIIATLTLSTILVSIPGGYKGVVISGVNIGDTFDSGIQFKHPLDTIATIPYSTKILETTIKVTTIDSVVVTVYTKIDYKISETYISYVRLNYPDYLNIIEHHSKSSAGDIASQYISKDIIGKNKANFSETVETLLKEELSHYKIIISKFSIQKMELPFQYQDAINQEKASERLRNATIVEAEGNAKAIEIINNQLSNTTESYLQWFYIQALINPNSNVKWVIPSDMTLILGDE